MKKSKQNQTFLHSQNMRHPIMSSHHHEELPWIRVEAVVPNRNNFPINAIDIARIASNGHIKTAMRLWKVGIYYSELFELFLISQGVA